MGNDFTNQPGQPPAPGTAPQPGLPAAPAGWPPAPAQAGWPPAPAQAGWPPAPQAPGAWPPAPQAPGAWPPPPAQPGLGAQQPGWAAPPPGTFAPPPGAYPPPPAGYPAYPAAFAGAPRYGGFWIRLVAYIIDSIILVALSIVLIITIIGILLLPFLWLGYFPFLWWRRGATFGMQALNLRIVRAIDGGPIDGSMAFVRGLVFWAENIFSNFLFIGLLGFIWAAFDERKRAWHDMAAGTVVIQG